MVIPRITKTARRRGSLMVELLAAMAILAGVAVPLGWSLASERTLARSLYQRAVAMEILDGELEVLTAGEWRAIGAGTREYQVHAHSATNLPPGAFTLTIDSKRVRLEWTPAAKHHGGAISREALFP